jgi:prepilin-type N-terminal cleavage/methylation domain-containing protein
MLLVGFVNLMFKKNQQGFTLIELLVVIAIIGILSGVVLASLGTARDKARDAATKTGLTQLRAEMEINADTMSGTYNLTGLASSNTLIANVNKTALEAVVVTGTTSTSSSMWAASAKLRNETTPETPDYFCVDSTGAAIVTTSAPADGIQACS